VIRLTYQRHPTHKECIHFNGNLCTFFNIPVNPNQPACPNFTPKIRTQTTQQTNIFFRSQHFDQWTVQRPVMKTQPVWLIKELEIVMLKERVEFLQEQLRRIRKRIEMLKTGTP